MAIGNGATDYHYDVWRSYPDVLHGLEMIPDVLYYYLKENNCTQYFRDVFPGTYNDTACRDKWQYMNDITTSIVNWYDLYRKVYAGGLATDEPKFGEKEIDGVIHKYKRGYSAADYTPWIKDNLGVGDNEPTITGGFMTDYLNEPDVQSALNMPQVPWTPCVNETKWTYDVFPKGSIWIYPLLKSKGARILFYSGDTDGAVPTLGTRRWIQNLGWKVTN